MELIYSMIAIFSSIAFVVFSDEARKAHSLVKAYNAQFRSGIAFGIFIFSGILLAHELLIEYL